MGLRTLRKVSFWVVGLAIFVASGDAVAKVTANKGRAMSTVGRYSNRDSSHHVRETSTVGIVLQIKGQAYAVSSQAYAVSPQAYAVSSKKHLTSRLFVGAGVFKDQYLFVDAHSLLKLATTSDGLVSIAGPATLQLSQEKNEIFLYRGILKFDSFSHSPLRFKTTYASGQVSQGSAVVWTSQNLKKTQMLALQGNLHAWYPTLAHAPMSIPAGHFTESAYEFKHLQPKMPALADPVRAQALLSHFYEKYQPVILPQKQEHSVHAEEEEPSKPRQIASKKKQSGSSYASRTLAMQKLMARVRGQDFGEEEGGGGLVEVPGRKVSSASDENTVHVGRPRLEIINEGKDLDESQKAFMRKLKGKRGY